MVTPTALLVANEGVPFTYERVKSLLRLGASEKTPRRERQHMIGYKGIGFSSVFEICDAPQVISQDVTFGFQPALARKQISSMLGIAPKNIPVRPFAQLLQVDAWEQDADGVDELFSRGAVTVVRLPLRRDKSPEQVEAALTRAITPEALLLMPAVDEIVASGPNLRISWRKRRGVRRGKGRVVSLQARSGERRAWLISEVSVSVPRRLLSELRDDAWTGVRHLKVIVGLPWDRQVDGDAHVQPLHVYFPTDDALGRALLVHGDFYVHSNRRTVETEGPGGEINGLLADRAARLSADLAASVARQGNPLLSALAPQSPASGFGRVISERLDAQLAEARIVRASSSRLSKPAEVMRLGTSLAKRDETLLADLAGRPGEILFPGDDDGHAEALLDALHVESIDSDDLALRLDGHRTTESYGVVASLLVRWLESLNSWERRATVDNLRQRPVLRDTHGNWRPARELVLRTSKRLALPEVLRREEALRPPGRYGSQLLSDLRVEVMDVANAVKSIGALVKGGRFGAGGAEARDVLRFLWSVWEATPEKLEAERANLGVIKVPVRPTGRGAQSWRSAQNVYFSGQWLDDRSLEQLYGPFGQAEFLAEKPPIEPRRRTNRRQFFAMLGVASSPRFYAVKTYPWRWGRLIRGVQDGSEWTRDALPQIECPASHPESMEIEVQVADRLDAVFDQLSVRRATALGAALARASDPFGPSAIIRCRHGSHDGKIIDRVPGYQDWLLETRDWVPVSADPADAVLRTPATSWTDIAARDSWLALPRASLPKGARQMFRLASPQRLSPESLEATLDILADAFDDPEQAPESVRRTAQWLQERLDRLLQQRKAEVGDAPCFLCRAGNAWTWATDPLIADVPGLESLDSLKLLPAGEWRGLRLAYRLKRASDVVSIRVVAGKRVASTGLLNNQGRAQILALIARHGADVDRATRRLAQIRVAPVASLSLDVSLNGANAMAPRNFYLDVTRAGRRISGVRLYHVPGSALSDAGLGREIAVFIDEPRLSHAIALVLRDPSDALSDEAVSPDDVAEALRSIENARRRGGREDDEEEIALGDVATLGDEIDEGEEEAVREEHEPPAGEAEAAEHADSAQGESGADNAPPSTSPVSETSSTGAATRNGTSITDADQRPPKALISDNARFGQPRVGQRRPRPQRGRRPFNQGVSRRGGSGGFIDSDPETEAKAMRIVERYGRDLLGAEIFDVHKDNKGWDLEFKLPDGTWQFVEVKGSSGDAAFPITRNERRAASDPEFRDRYVLYWVANAGSPAKAEIRRFRAIGLHLTEDLLDPLQWEVFDWSALPHEVIPLSDELAPGERRG